MEFIRLMKKLLTALIQLLQKAKRRNKHETFIKNNTKRYLIKCEFLQLHHMNNDYVLVFATQVQNNFTVLQLK